MRKIDVLHDRIAFKIAAGDLRIAAQLGHEAETNAGGDISRGVGRALPIRVREKTEHRPLRVEHALLDLLKSILAQRADCADMQPPVLRFGEA